MHPHFPFGFYGGASVAKEKATIRWYEKTELQLQELTVKVQLSDLLAERVEVKKCSIL